MAVALLILVFLVVPLVELAVIMAVGSMIGILPTLLILLAVSILGGWLVKRIGIGVWQRARRTARAGQLPADELLDGSVVVGAGALLLVPGFVTDLCGLILLAPPVRRGVGHLVRKRIERGANVTVRTVRVENTWTTAAGPDVVDGELAVPPPELEP